MYLASCFEAALSFHVKNNAKANQIPNLAQRRTLAVMYTDIQILGKLESYCIKTVSSKFSDAFYRLAICTFMKAL